MPGGMGDYELTTAVDDPVKPCGIYYIQARKYGDTSIIYNSVEEIKRTRLFTLFLTASNRLVWECTALTLKTPEMEDALTIKSGSVVVNLNSLLVFKKYPPLYCTQHAQL